MNTPDYTHKASPRAGRTRLDPERRQAQLLQCALTAFAESGMDRTVHADVAALANVSTPTVFKYFPTRDALVDAVLSRVEDSTITMLESYPARDKVDTDAMVKVMAEGIGLLCLNSPDMVKIVMGWSVAFSSVRPRFLAFQDTCLNLVQARISPAGSDRSDARILLGAAHLYMQMHFDGSSDDVRRRYVERMAELLSGAVKS